MTNRKHLILRSVLAGIGGVAIFVGALDEASAELTVVEDYRYCDDCMTLFYGGKSAGAGRTAALMGAPRPQTRAARRGRPSVGTKAISVGFLTVTRFSTGAWLPRTLVAVSGCTVLRISHYELWPAPGRERGNC